MSNADRIEKLRDLAESNFLAGTPISDVANLIADELEQQRLRLDGVCEEIQPREVEIP